MRPPYFPAFIDLAGRSVIVLGEDRVAERKALRLLKYGADVTVITPTPTEVLRRSEAEGLLNLVPRAYAAGDLRGAAVVVCASSDAEVNRTAASEARSLNCLVNIHDDVPGSNYLVPGVVDRGPVQIAVSTAGQAPALSKVIRRRVAAAIGQEWAGIVEYLAAIRLVAQERGYSRDRLASAVDWLLAGEVLEQALEGRPLEPARALDAYESHESGDDTSA